LPGFLFLAQFSLEGIPFGVPFFLCHKKSGLREIGKALMDIEAMAHLGIIKLYAIGGGVAATYFIILSRS